MRWETQLLEIENSFGSHMTKDWIPSLSSLKKLIANYPDEVELNVRTIYILHNILVEEEHSVEDREFISGLLLKYFEESYERFSENPEYLFFIGKILYISEWYFGINDDLKPIENRKAFKMQKEAFEREPQNLLFKWAYYFSKNEKYIAYELSKELLFNNKSKLNWLKSKGFPGKYLIKSIEYCFENYKK